MSHRVRALATGIVVFVAPLAAMAAPPPAATPVTPAPSATPAVPPATPEAARAEQLFDEGTRLLDQKRYADALPLLLESQRLGPGIGIMMYIADCYDGLGRTTKALALFREAEEAARAKKDGRDALARQRAEEVAARVPSLVVKPSTPIDGALVVSVDDERLKPERWSQPVQLDPGPHVVRAESGPHAWSVSVDLPAMATSTVVLVPQLRTSTDAAQGPPRPLHAAAIIQLLGGSLLIGGGLYFGLDAIAKKNASLDGHCDASSVCDAAGLDLRRDGLDAARISTILVTTGLLAIASGAVMYVLDTRRSTAKLGSSGGRATGATGWRAAW